MANTQQAKKRVRQADKQRRHNASLKSMMRTVIKNTVKAIHANSKEVAETAYQKMVPIIDRMATKGLVTQNKVARHKSRLTHRIRQMS